MSGSIGYTSRQPRAPRPPERPRSPEVIQTWEDVDKYIGREVTLKAPIHLKTNGLGLTIDTGTKIILTNYDPATSTVQISSSGVHFNIQTQLLSLPLEILPALV